MLSGTSGVDGVAARGRRRVGVDHAVHVGPLLVDLEVEQYFARGFAVPFYAAARGVQDDDVVGREGPLTQARRRRGYEVAPDAAAHIPVRRGDEAALVATSPYFDYLFSRLPDIHIGSSGG